MLNLWDTLTKIKLEPRQEPFKWDNDYCLKDIWERETRGRNPEHFQWKDMAKKKEGIL